MSKVLPVCAAALFLITVSSIPRFAAAAAPGPAGAAQPQVQPAAKPPVKSPALQQNQPQAAPPAVKEPTVKALPLMRKVSLMPQKPVMANVDLRPDVVSAIQTEPSITNYGAYNPYNNMGKPLQVTAVVENSGFTKAEKVEIGFYFSRMPGAPLKQNAWEYHYTADLGPGEAVSYPFSILFHSTTVQFTVNADFPGDEKNKVNNRSIQFVRF